MMTDEAEHSASGTGMLPVEQSALGSQLPFSPTQLLWIDQMIVNRQGRPSTGSLPSTAALPQDSTAVHVDLSTSGEYSDG